VVGRFGALLEYRDGGRGGRVGEPEGRLLFGGFFSLPLLCCLAYQTRDKKS